MKLHGQHVMSGFLSALLACTGGAVLIVSSAEIAGFTNHELISWMISVYCIGGLLNAGLSLYYKIPFGGAHSITAAAFLSTSVIHFSIEELAGAAIMAGLLIAVFGISGLADKLLAFLPKPLMDAMLAGLIFNHIVKIVPSVKESVFIGLMSVAGYFLFPKLFKQCPPIIGVICMGMLALWIGYDFPALDPIPFTLPQATTPIFTWNGFISIALPLTLLVLSNDIFVALAALRKNGYEPSAVKVLTISGIVSTLVGWFGGHSVNIGGMMTMLCSSEEAGPKDRRYYAAIVSGLIVALFGVFSWKVVGFLKILPLSFILIVTGFSLLGIFVKSMQSAFSRPLLGYSTIFTFIIAVSNIAFLGISAPVWSLIVGMIVMRWLGEHKADFKEK